VGVGGGSGRMLGGGGWIRVGVVYIKTSGRILTVRSQDRRFPATRSGGPRLGGMFACGCRQDGLLDRLAQFGFAMR
jgi:hypothetical protein